MSATAQLMKPKKGKAKSKSVDPETKDAAKKMKAAKPKAIDVLKATQTPKGTKTKATKTKATKAVVKANKGDVLPPDQISLAANEIENLKDAKTATEMAHGLYDGVDFDLFKLGGVLTVVQDKGWYEPYEAFRDYVEGEFAGLKYRKALYLVEIYGNLVAAGIEWETVKAVGWTKLKEIASIITPKNVDKWVKKAMKLKTLQLIEEVKQAKKGTAEKGSEAGAAAASVGTKTFKLHEDQRSVVDEALEKARNEVDTQYDSVAIEQVCLSYLSGPKGKKGSAMPTPGDMFKHVLAKNDGDVEATMGEIFAEFESEHHIKEAGGELIH